MVLDSLRTMVIWAVSLALNWESFCWIELLGFAVLILGTVTYNAIIKLPGLSYEESAPAEADAALLDDDGGVYNTVDDDFDYSAQGAR
jgi:hypothetical protein